MSTVIIPAVVPTNVHKDVAPLKCLAVVRPLCHLHDGSGYVDPPSYASHLPVRFPETKKKKKNMVNRARCQTHPCFCRAWSVRKVLEMHWGIHALHHPTHRHRYTCQYYILYGLHFCATFLRNTTLTVSEKTLNGNRARLKCANTIIRFFVASSVHHLFLYISSL